MKKIISLGLALAFAAYALPAQAELLKNLTTKGEIEIQSLHMHNHDLNSNANDEISQALTRVLYGANFDLVDDVNAQLSFCKVDRRYGQVGQTVAGIQGLIAITESNITLKNIFGLEHKLGRQYYGEPGDLIVYFGPLRHPYTLGMGVASLDAWKGTWTNDKWVLTGLIGKTAEAVAQNTNGDTDLWGLIGNYNMSEPANITGYWYRAAAQNPANPTAGNPNNHLNVIGAKVTGKIDKFNYKGELAMNTGNSGFATNLNYTGMGLLANMGYDMDIALGVLGFTGEFARGSGDDNGTDKDNAIFIAINSDYRPGIIYGGSGLFDLNGLGGFSSGIGNLTTWNLGAKFAPKAYEKLTLGLKFYNFSFSENPAAGIDTPIGSEWDLCATWKHSENVSVMGSLAKFAAAEDSFIAKAIHTAGIRLDSAVRYGVDFMVKF